MEYVHLSLCFFNNLHLILLELLLKRKIFCLASLLFNEQLNIKKLNKKTRAKNIYLQYFEIKGQVKVNNKTKYKEILQRQ